ncbi:MAG: alpha/beta hydrolase [Myxococcota bacterium]|nr:alpha/beta hydrolase [Myxococcota bacterium]
MKRIAVAALLLGTGCLGFHAGALPGEPADATFAELEGARVRFVDEGEGPPVVLVHGFASSLDVWAGVRPALVAAGYRVIALDLKGFGWSGRPQGDYTVRAQARLVMALMDARGVEHAAVVAHSYGSSIALAVALEAPARVDRIALYDAFVYPGQRNTFAEWADADGMGELLFAAFYDQRPDERAALAYYDPDRIPQALIEAYEGALDRPGTEAAALATVRGMRFEHERYAEIEAPVLLLWGREDLVSRLSWGERLQAELPNAELRVYPRCGHFPMVEAARPSLRDLMRFLDEGRAEDAPGLRAPVPVESAPLEPASAASAPVAPAAEGEAPALGVEIGEPSP